MKLLKAGSHGQWQPWETCGMGGVTTWGNLGKVKCDYLGKVRCGYLAAWGRRRHAIYKVKNYEAEIIKL